MEELTEDEKTTLRGMLLSNDEASEDLAFMLFHFCYGKLSPDEKKIKLNEILKKKDCSIK